MKNSWHIFKRGGAWRVESWGKEGAYQATSTGAERGQRARMVQHRPSVKAGRVWWRGRSRVSLCPGGIGNWIWPLLHRETLRQEATISPEQQVQVSGEGRDSQ